MESKLLVPGPRSCNFGFKQVQFQLLIFIQRAPSRHLPWCHDAEKDSNICCHSKCSIASELSSSSFCQRQSWRQRIPPSTTETNLAGSFLADPAASSFCARLEASARSSWKGSDKDGLAGLCVSRIDQLCFHSCVIEAFGMWFYVQLRQQSCR